VGLDLEAGLMWVWGLFWMCGWYWSLNGAGDMLVMEVGVVGADYGVGSWSCDWM